jgi:hypothetical protein
VKIDRKKFFAGFRHSIDSSIEQEQVDGLEFLLGKMENDAFWVQIPQCAYMLATVYHETAGSFQPVEEGYYLAEKHGQSFLRAFQKKLRYYPYYGRGYVQLTHETNYKKAGKAFGVDLVNKPQLALEPDIAYKILTYGMHQGWFTGKKLEDYISDTGKDYVNARKIVNGKDRAGLIAGYARSFEEILRTSKTLTAPSRSTPEQPDSNLDTATNTLAEDPSTSGPSANIAVEKEEPLGFWATLWKKFTGASFAVGGINGLTDTAEKAQTFGLSAEFWERLFYIAAIGIGFWILSEVVRWFYTSWQRRKRTDTLALVNSTPDNQVHIVPPDLLHQYEREGGTVVRRNL